MDSTETIPVTQLGFDNALYLKKQSAAITERMSHFTNGTMYLEIGGKFLYDPHAARVLLGFNPKIKPDIIKAVDQPFEIIFCVNAKDIESNRMLTNVAEDYTDSTLKIIAEYSEVFDVEISVVINLVSELSSKITDFKQILESKGYKTYLRYIIPGYPDPKVVVSDNGYAKDEYVPTKSPLVLVIGPASNSGKMSTCLGQIYHDQQKGKDSGYAKFELFPIWNLPLKHPVNLAYEAATADIGDFNLYDYHHENAYRIDAVNYNRDVDAFPIITGLLKEIIPKNNYMQTYKSPTDMGMNMAGYAITNDQLVANAGIDEIIRRKQWYEELLQSGLGEQKWIDRCEELLEQANLYGNLTK